MGKYLDKFKRGAKKVKEKVKEVTYEPGAVDDNDFPDEEYYEEDKDSKDNSYKESFDDVGIQPSQKPESFHHFILENQYKDLERSIRGFKDVFDKSTRKWETKRKKEHCFTDEEAEEILRTAQSHLATDVKLGYISKESFPLMMNTIYKELAFLFESIAEYRYGRYNLEGENNQKKKVGETDKIEIDKVNYEKQYKMKLMNQKIFLELFTRVQANYSRAIQGQENRLTHQSVKGQESLQNTEPEYGRSERYS